MVSPVRVQLLVDMAPNEAAVHGFKRCDMIAPAGSYKRRPPHFLGTEHAADPDSLFQQTAALTQHHGAILRLILTDATVTGQGAVVTGGDGLLFESCAEFLNHGRIPDGLLRSAEDEEMHVQRPPARHIAMPSLLVKRPWWRNYGHWLIDGAALLAMIPWGIMPREWQVVVGKHEDHRMQMVVHDTLARLAPNIAVVEQPDDEPWSFSELHYITPVHVPPLFKLPAARDVVRHAFLCGLPSPAENGRFYVQRDPQGGRRVVNEAELLDVCAARGLSVIRPEQFSVLEQARMFASCELVVGVKGAGLINTMFSPSSLGMIVLSPGSWTDPFFWDLVAQMDIEYTEIIGPVATTARGPSANDFHVDLRILADVLDRQIARLARWT